MAWSAVQHENCTFNTNMMVAVACVGVLGIHQTKFERVFESLEDVVCLVV